MGNTPPERAPRIPPSAFRQPPPPPPLVAGGVAEAEGETERVGGNSACSYSLRRCKRKRLITIGFDLPNDLLFKILARVPAQDLYEQARLVCWNWYLMIRSHNFIYEHLWNTTYGLLIQSLSPTPMPGTFAFSENPVLIALREGRFEIHKYSYLFRYPVYASCNGLLLEFDINHPKAVYITNPVTKQMFLLPDPLYSTEKHLFGIGYVAASMEYKVVFAHHIEEKLCASIITAGVDKSWRNLCIQHLSHASTEAFHSYLLMTQGFMHWVSGRKVLTLNLETEIITEALAPISHVYVRENCYYLSTGRYLSLLIICGMSLMEAWEMKPETGEWRKLASVVVKEFADYNILYPLGWLNYPDVLIFTSVKQGEVLMGFYNLVTEETGLVDVRLYSTSAHAPHHRNTLMWNPWLP